jgi:nucleotide-binding universal stress UspA family protein
MKNLLAAVDFSDASNCVVEKAGELAQELSARIVLLHIVEPVATQLHLKDAADVVFAAAWPLQTPKRLKARLNSLALPLRAAGLDVESVAHVGLVVDDILKQSVKYHAELIIVGCHGHLAAQHFFSGNVLTGILRRQPPCPMIVVPVTDASELRASSP